VLQVGALAAVHLGVIGSVRDVFFSGLQGLRAASDKLYRAANSVERGFVETPSDSVSVSREARSAATSEPDVLGGLVDLRVARYAAAASLAVLRTADEMSATVLDPRRG